MDVTITVPTRGNIDRIERFTSDRTGRDRIRVLSDDDAVRHEPPSITELLTAAGVTLTPADGTVEMTALEDLDGGRSQVVRITGPASVVTAIRSWSESRSMQMMRDETDSPEPNRDGLVVTDLRLSR